MIQFLSVRPHSISNSDNNNNSTSNSSSSSNYNNNNIIYLCDAVLANLHILKGELKGGILYKEVGLYCLRV